MLLHVPNLPSCMEGVNSWERKSHPRCVTPIKVWPVLAVHQADTLFQAASMGACGHKGHRACWRCGCRTNNMRLKDGSLGGRCATHTATFLPCSQTCNMHFDGVQCECVR